MRPRAGTLFAPVREWLLLERAESTVRAYTPTQRAVVRQHFAAAGSRVRAARAVGDPASASVLLREAALHFLRARRAGAPGAESSSWSACSPRELATDLPEIPANPYDASVCPTDVARDAIATQDPLYFDRLSQNAAEQTRACLERATRVLGGQVEPRSVDNIRAARWGRLAGIGVLLLYLAYRVVAALLLPTNVALHKPVHASSYRVNPPDGHELVDGHWAKSYGIHTDTEDSPRVTIDLVGVYRLKTIKVYNRGDGWFDDCLPLIVEVSSDDKTYVPIARRDTHFDQDPPWSVDAGMRQARYVRLRGERRSYIALSQVEVLGKK